MAAARAVKSVDTMRWRWAGATGAPSARRPHPSACASTPCTMDPPTHVESRWMPRQQLANRRAQFDQRRPQQQRRARFDERQPLQQQRQQQQPPRQQQPLRQRQWRLARLRERVLGLRGVFAARRVRAALVPRHGHRPPLRPVVRSIRSPAWVPALPAHPAARRRGVPLARRLGGSAPADRGAPRRARRRAPARTRKLGRQRHRVHRVHGPRDRLRAHAVRPRGRLPALRTAPSSAQSAARPSRRRCARDPPPTACRARRSVRPRVSCRPSPRTRPPRPPPPRPTRGSRGWAASAAPSGRRTASSCRARTRSGVQIARRPSSYQRAPSARPASRRA